MTNIRPIYIDCADFAKLSGSTFAGTVTLDDGVGASPSFVMTDATDESLTISKVDAGYATMTTVAGDGVQITTGNLRVGNAASTQTLDGEDMYVEGVLENDGGLYLDGGLLVNTTNGTAISAIRFAFDAVASGGTSKTTTLTGATSSSRCVASAAETATNAVYIRSVVPGTNQVVITTSGDPGASNLDYTVICFN